MFMIYHKELYKTCAKIRKTLVILCIKHLLIFIKNEICYMKRSVVQNVYDHLQDLGFTGGSYVKDT